MDVSWNCIGKSADKPPWTVFDKDEIVLNAGSGIGEHIAARESVTGIEIDFEFNQEIVRGNLSLICGKELFQAERDYLECGEFPVAVQSEQQIRAE